MASLSLLLLLLNFPKTRTGRMANCMQQHHEKFPTGAKKKGFGRSFWLLPTVLWRQRKKLKPLSFPRFYSPIPLAGIWSCFCRKDILVELWVRPSPVGGLLQPGTCSFCLAISDEATAAPELQVEKRGKGLSFFRFFWFVGSPPPPPRNNSSFSDQKRELREEGRGKG